MSGATVKESLTVGQPSNSPCHNPKGRPATIKDYLKVRRQVRGSLGAHEQGLIITTSDFSKGARTEAERPDALPVALMNAEQLVSLLVENQIGVSRKPHELIELGETEEVAE